MQESIDTPSHQKKDKSPKHEEGSGSSSDEPHNNNSDSENEESSKKSEQHRGKEAKKYEKLEKGIPEHKSQSVALSPESRISGGTPSAAALVVNCVSAKLAVPPSSQRRHLPFLA
uniref:CTNNB1_binding domain-containing protein n=1 Tax=Globodera pallida TaxID=36090 RepID=A0A183C0I9_GLOPA